MEDNTLVESSFSATMNAPIEKVDIPAWCFTLREAEYQSCSPAHCSASARRSVLRQYQAGSYNPQRWRCETSDLEQPRSFVLRVLDRESYQRVPRGYRA